VESLVKGVHRFQREVVETRKAWFAKLAEGQAPEALFLTCSDSRINPNLLTQSEPGELFIVRNAGNIIPPAGSGGSGELGTIEFAVQGLGIEHIIVCGHSDCGAIKALLNPESTAKMPGLRQWLAHAELTKRVIDENYPNHADREQLLEIAIQNQPARMGLQRWLRRSLCLRRRRRSVPTAARLAVSRQQAARQTSQPMMPKTVDLEQVHERRLLGLWFAFCASMGATNAGALLACQRFVSHVTGTVTRIGVDVEEPRLLAEYACVLFSFMAGAYAARRLFERSTRLFLPPLVGAVIMTLAAAIGMTGRFGPFGRTVETLQDFELLVLLSAATGLVNGALALLSRGQVRVAHMTGPVTDLMLALAEARATRDTKTRAMAIRTARMRAGNIFFFIVGAAAVAVVAPYIEYLVFLVPGVLLAGLAVATPRMLSWHAPATLPTSTAAKT
jgi:carbonic anhydrase/uncharacterized membrane protein YoaK (UPF0700 family)